MILVIIFLLGGLAIIMHNYSKISTLKYDVNKSKDELTELDNEIRFLKLEIEESSRINLIEEKAKKDLNMQYRDPNQIIYVTVD